MQTVIAIITVGLCAVYAIGRFVHLLRRPSQCDGHCAGCHNKNHTSPDV